MQILKFPMTVTHRENPHAVVTVASQEQYDALPDEYKLQVTGGQVAEPIAASAIPGVNLDVTTSGTGDNGTAIAEDAERRQSLDEAVDEFTAHVQAETAKIDAARAQLEQDRTEHEQNVAKYAAQFVLERESIKDDREALARERAEFEAQRATTTAGTGDIAGDTGTDSAAAEGAGTADIAAPAAAPAKRTRAAAKEGA